MTSIETFLKNLRLKWKTAGRHRDRFSNNYNEWLSKPAIAVASNYSTAGRPNVSFGDASERTKKQKILPNEAVMLLEESTDDDDEM